MEKNNLNKEENQQQQSQQEQGKSSKVSEKTERLPDCCKQQGKHKGFLQGIAFGLIPHAGCIAFIVASILGLTVAASFFRPLLAKSYFFYLMIALSLVFATFSAFFYLRRFGGLKEAKNHKRYLTILYGSTILVSVLLYFVIFPLVTGSVAGSANSITGAAIDLGNLNTITLDVAIPCPGHAPLITGDLQKINGVVKVEYSPIKTFKVYYDPSKTSKEQILALDIFKEYKATVTNEDNSGSNSISVGGNAGSSGGSCCGATGCGSSTSGSCGCGDK